MESESADQVMQTTTDEALTSREKCKYLILGRREYTQVQIARMAKHRATREGMSYTDYIFAHDMFYIVENYGFGAMLQLAPVKRTIMDGHDHDTKGDAKYK